MRTVILKTKEFGAEPWNLPEKIISAENHCIALVRFKHLYTENRWLQQSSFVNLTIFRYKYSANMSGRSQFLHCEELSLARNLLLLIHIQRKPWGSYQDYPESKLPNQERNTGSRPRSRSPPRSTRVRVWQRFILAVCLVCWCPQDHSLEISELRDWRAEAEFLELGKATGAFQEGGIKPPIPFWVTT